MGLTERPTGPVGGRTLLDKLWDQHVVRHGEDGGADLLYVDLHLIHEVTSPQAFEGLRLEGRPLRRPELTLATMDHNVPTWSRLIPISDPLAQQQVDTLEANCAEFGVRLFGMTSARQGIVHMVGPEFGLTRPGISVVCGDSHTGTHGAFGALAFGIGTSEIEHVFATQTLALPKPRSMAVEVRGALGFGVTPKDLILAIIARIGASGAVGHVVEYRGEAIEQMSMEGRMTVCNMSVEAGARSGLIAPDQVTFDYLRDKPCAPTAADWDQALADWAALSTDSDARFDRVVEVDGGAVRPTVTWGTTPAMSTSVDGRVPRPEETANPEQTRKALAYMGLAGGEAVEEITVDHVFIGSCTNGRIEDLRAAAQVVAGKRVADSVTAMVVPGSVPVKRQAEAEGLDRIFAEAGLDWREPGCSMCLGMNPDVLPPGARCAATSNRNFEGRQGRGSRTHLVSPPMAAAAALHGRFVDVRRLS